MHKDCNTLPDGIFLGLNWYALERDTEGLCWRWMDSNAQIVITNPSGRKRGLIVDLLPGPGFGGKLPKLILRNADQVTVATVSVQKSGVIVLSVPLPASKGTTYTLDTEGGGVKISGDPRILNFRVFGLRWAD